MPPAADTGGQPDPILVSAGKLKQLLNTSANPHLLAVDARSPRRYAAGHIPAAVNLPLSLLVQLEGTAQALVPAEVFAARAGAAGIDAETDVVVYGERGGMDAAYLYWALEYYGHSRLLFLDGGLEAWLRAGGELSGEPAVPRPRTFVPRVRPELRADADGILKRLGDPAFQLVDTRSVEEFSGRGAVVLRGGHIPGAIRVDWDDDLDENLTFRPAGELAERLGRAGVDPGKETVLYCLGGPRAAHVYLALKLAGGKRLSLYDRSFAEWGNRADLPVEREAE